MKKQTLSAIVLAALLLFSGCAVGSSKTPVENETPPAGGTSEPSQTPQPGGTPAPSFTISDAEAFLNREPGAAEICTYMEENAEQLSPEAGDLLLERLILAQLDISQRMSSLIYEEAYMTALNDVMGGVLDESKIANITDESVRKDYQEIADSLMKVVRYEETPVVEPDWNAIEKIGLFSENAAAMVMYRSRLQDWDYHGDPYNFDLAAEDIAAMEKLLNGMENGFVRWQLKQNYDRLVSTVLFGPEGSYLYMLMDGDEQILGNIERYAEEYQGTRFGSMCADLKGLQGVDMQAVSDYIIDRLNFPPGDQRSMTALETEYSGAALSILKINGLNDPTIEEKIYEAALSEAQAMIKPQFTEQSLTSYSSFVNDLYFGLSLVYSYTDENGQFEYTEKNLTFDLKTGENLTLDALVGQPLEAYKSILLDNMFGGEPMTDINAPVEFSIYSEGILILVPSEEYDWPQYYNVTLNGLRKFMDVAKLY
jgi:hypothetical protein